MKKNLFLMGLLLGLTVLMSCSGDEAFGDNELVVGEAVYPILGGDYYTYGANFNSQGRYEAAQVEEYTHWITVVSFWDSETESCSESCNAAGILYLVSKGAEEFKNGSFEVTEFYPEVGADAESFAFIGMEANSEVYPYSYWESNSGGKIKVSGEAPNFVLEFNFEATAYTPSVETRVNGEETVTVKGQFKGELTEEINN